MKTLFGWWLGVTHVAPSLDQLCFCELESISHSVWSAIGRK